MEIYQQKSRWKIILAFSAILIIIISMVYTKAVVEQVRAEEKRKVEIWAKAIAELNKDEYNPSLGFLTDLMTTEKSIPAIITDLNGNIENWNNLDPKKEDDPAYLERQLEKMKGQYEPIEIELYEVKSLVYRKDSSLLQMMKLFPIIQLGLIALFIVFGYVAFSSARKAEQNRIWVGLAKETAHQLGTPITSLVAWVEHLKLSTEGDETSQELLAELGKDMGRLELIAERFSKIGSIPEIKAVNIFDSLSESFSYMERRAPRRVEFEYPYKDAEPLTAHLNPPLFNWVLENLLKNSLDALEGKGKIWVEVFEDAEFTYIDISDTGKGIPANKLSTVFKPGYSTKKRGWGLGLSLSKRIIENYHSGKIFVKESTLNEGTTFRIQLPKKRAAN
ncbi:MAG: HAMP domain-containing sensor histidine kinase [Bacteroidota bacterium]